MLLDRPSAKHTAAKSVSRRAVADRKMRVLIGLLRGIAACKHASCWLGETETDY